MTDIREQIFKKHSIENEAEYTLEVLHEKQALEAMDEYAIKVLQHVHSDFYFSEVTDIKKYLEEIKTELNESNL